MLRAILIHLFKNVKSGLSRARSGVRQLWATSPTFQAFVIAPPIFVRGYWLLVMALLVL